MSTELSEMKIWAILLWAVSVIAIYEGLRMGLNLYGAGEIIVAATTASLGWAAWSLE